MAEQLSINYFVTTFSNGFIHPNLFKVTFTFETGYNKVSGDLKTLGMACKTAKIPGVTFTEGKYSVDGKFRKFASGADLDPAEFVFLVDNDRRVINLFDSWGAAIYNNQEGSFGFKEEYQCEITVEILDRSGKSIYEGTLHQAYPTVISSFEMSSENENQVMEYNITFNFDWVTTK